jgi:hypothetical protein
MNETDFIRQQLAAERAHLREILRAVAPGSGPAQTPRPISAYVDWASQRLLNQLSAHHSALQALPTIAAATRAQLAEVANAATQVHPAAAGSASVEAARLLELLESWSAPLDALAGAALRVGHWRRCADLSADTILEERQLYAAARVAAGLR